MPQYIMDVGDPSDWMLWNNLSPFVQGYIECSLFCGVERPENDPEKDRDKLDDCSFAEIEPDTLREMISDCRKFEYRTARRWLNKAYKLGYTREQAGRDLWYTRNGHGVGFWDRKVLEKNGLGDKLAEFCGTWKPFGEYNLWATEEGTVYGSKG